jgi:RNA polymerase sigma-70 factor (ECF subfamily)
MTRMGATLPEIEDAYRRRGHDFYRFALARTGDPSAAQDAVQEGFAHAIRGRKTFRRSGTIDAWIGRCVVNAAKDAAQCRIARDPLPEWVEAASAPVPPDEGVRRAVRALPERQRDALFLRFYLDFDYDAIAEALGVKVGTVSATLHAARQTLTQRLEEVAR